MNVGIVISVLTVKIVLSYSTALIAQIAMHAKTATIVTELKIKKIKDTYGMENNSQK